VPEPTLPFAVSFEFRLARKCLRYAKILIAVIVACFLGAASLVISGVRERIRNKRTMYIKCFKKIHVCNICFCVTCYFLLSLFVLIYVFSETSIRGFDTPISAVYKGDGAGDTKRRRGKDVPGMPGWIDFSSSDDVHDAGDNIVDARDGDFEK
jgi:hypothetical protein